MELINKVLIPITDPANAAPYLELADSICLTPPDQLIDPAETDAYRRALLATFAG